MARLTVLVSPGAARSELIGRHGEGWKVRVTAAPERGRANDAVVELLAAMLEIPREQLRIVAGSGARRKVIEIDGVDAADIDRRLTDAGER
jgi:uncharacterized protein (TIGR00251 family)